MKTPEFKQSHDELAQLANQERIVLMRAEVVPWRCHRSFIADALLVREIRSEEIMSPTRCQVQMPAPFAKGRGNQITYPAETLQSAATEPRRKRARS